MWSHNLLIVGEFNMVLQPLSSWGTNGGERSIWLHNSRFLAVPIRGVVNMAM